jgi:hypothetical protein
MGLKFSKKKNNTIKTKPVKIKDYSFNHNVVKIKHYNMGSNSMESNNRAKYSYIYKGVPGGWYVD